jgi:hypothetical protein
VRIAGIVVMVNYSQPRNCEFKSPKQYSGWKEIKADEAQKF